MEMRWRVVLRVDPNPAIGEALNDWHATHDSAMVAFFQEWPFGGSKGVMKEQPVSVIGVMAPPVIELPNTSALVVASSDSPLSR